MVNDYVSLLANSTLKAVMLNEPPFTRFLTKDFNPRDIKRGEVEGEVRLYIVPVIGLSLVSYRTLKIIYNINKQYFYNGNGKKYHCERQLQNLNEKLPVRHQNLILSIDINIV